MKISKLQYITQGATEEDIYLEVREYLDAGGDWLQLRVKSDKLDFLPIAKKVQKMCKDRATFIVNDKVEVAAAISADGVHLGLTDMPIYEARKILGEGVIIGGTANSVVDCESHVNDGANYIGLGPFRYTETKKKLSPVLGLDGYVEVLGENRITIPVVAIGGIEMKDVNHLMRLKSDTRQLLHGVAVSGLIKRSTDKKGLIKELRTNLNS